MAKSPVKSRARQSESAPFEPARWTDLVGYDQAKEQLKSLVQRDRLSHTVLVEGREGNGKRAFLAYISALFWCDTQTACGSCSSCLWVMRGGHDEVYWLEAAALTNYSVEDVAKLQEHLETQSGAHQAGGQGRRIVVLVDCDRLNKQGANRLLKIMEEPPEGSLLLMSTSRPGLLLPTFLSRLFRYRVRLPSLEEGAQRLLALVEPQVTLEQAMEALKVSGHSIGMAKSKLEAGLSWQEEYEGLIKALFAPQVSDSIKMIEEHVRQKKLGANELVKRIEVILNQYYKVHLGIALDFGGVDTRGGLVGLGLERVRHWRRLLKEVKGLAINGKVALNAQLVAESFALAGR